MPTVFDSCFVKALNTITKASDIQLSLSTFNETVFQSCKINIPRIALDETKVEIVKEKISSWRDAPEGIGFSLSGNTVVEYAQYSIPIRGDVNIFSQLVKQYIDTRKIFIQHNKLFYKEYSNYQISGNDPLIEAIKNRVKNFTTNVNNLLKSFEEQVNEFNETKLKPAVKLYIKEEIDKRNLRTNSETKLNPFI